MEYISTIIMVCVIIWGVMQKRKNLSIRERT